MGDCLEVLATYPDNFFDLIITSPPYADSRTNTSKVGSGLGKNVSNWLDRKMAYPTNVLHLATETGNRQHSAVFPKVLPAWFIKLFTQEYDYVLDPFCGSGTTGQVAQSLVRHSVGIEIKEEYYELAKANLNNPVNYQLFEYVQ